MCQMNFLSNILTWLILPGPFRIKLFSYILLWDKECVLSFTSPPPLKQLVVPKANQEINEPSYEMVGVKITVTSYGQNKSYFWHFFSCWFFIFFSDNSKCFYRNGFEMYLLIIIYTICTCDTLVPTGILNSEILTFGCTDHEISSPT
jgi:hypothetical protein